MRTKENVMSSKRQRIPAAELRVLAHKARTLHAFETYVLDAYDYCVVAAHPHPDGELLVISDYMNTKRGTIVWRDDGCHR
tara:strand:- start:195 stop:434 length:240 start_codon:yes stop_codon:yes gene_type:complete